MLTMHPHQHTETARHILRWRHRGSRNQVLMGVVALLHLWGGVNMLFAPRNLFTEGTRPVFALAPPVVWGCIFLLGGVLVALLISRVTAVRQVITWMVVVPTQTVWLAASVLAVLQGRGTAMGVTFLVAAWLWTVITALFVAIDDLTGKR